MHRVCRKISVCGVASAENLIGTLPESLGDLLELNFVTFRRNNLTSLNRTLPRSVIVIAAQLVACLPARPKLVTGSW